MGLVPTIQCFMVEPTGLVDIQLRRFHSTSDMKSCDVNSYGYHNASVTIETNQPAVKTDEGYYAAIKIPHDDPRWPKECVCGYQFPDTDYWQVNQLESYLRLDNGDVLPGPRHKLPPGAMWYANKNWPFYYPNPQDGEVLAVMTPGGEWVIDGRANNGPADAAGWSRTGTPPHVTVTPSIQAGPYHGWLRDGCLVD